MDEPDLYDVFVHPLHDAGVRYMIVGSVASMHYGEPRFTMDVDLVVELTEPDIAKLAKIFPEHDYYVPSADIILHEVQRPEHGHFNVIHIATGLKADFYPPRRGGEWNWVWDNRRCHEVEKHAAYFAPPEYVILSKLEFYRDGGSDKHLRDIRSMLAVSGDEIDRARIEDAVTKLDLAQQWQQANAG